MEKPGWLRMTATMVAFVGYMIPWIILQRQWPLFVPLGSQRFPGPLVTIGIGLGGFAASLVGFVIVVPWALRRRGRPDAAADWQSGALRTAFGALVLVSLHVAMRLPIGLGLRVITMIAIDVAGGIALHLATRWLRAPPSDLTA